MPQALLILTSLPDLQSAQAIAHQLVEQHLAACVSLLPSVRSIYQWQGRVEESQETVLLIKTTQARYAELETALQALHPYQVPEIIAFPAVTGLAAYLEWIATETKKDVDV